MEIFTSVIFQIAVLFSFIFVGFILRKGNFIPEESSVVFSKLENRIFMPAVVINTFWTNCTVKNISEKWTYIVYSFCLLAFCVLAGFIIGRFLGKTPYLQKIYRYSISVSNFGFVGTAMVSGIYGADSIELFDYLMFTLPLNMFTYSIGIAWLVPDSGKGLTFKSFLNPIFVYINYIREIILYGHIPSVTYHLYALIYALVILKIGAWMYKKYNYMFLYYI